MSNSIKATGRYWTGSPLSARAAPRWWGKGTQRYAPHVAQLLVLKNATMFTFNLKINAFS